jgi:hypothetical protein
VDWVDEDSDNEDTSSSKTPEKSVRLLDYACGTGLVSRVRTSSQEDKLMIMIMIRLWLHTLLSALE